MRIETENIKEFFNLLTAENCTFTQRASAAAAEAGLSNEQYMFIGLI